MKFASFPKFALSSLLAGVFALALTGCGASNNLALTQGNWSMTATPSGGGTFYVGGNLTQTGSSVAGTMYVVSSGCFSSSTPVPFNGTVKEKKVTLTSASVEGQVITVTVSGTTGSALTGTYSVAGGCADGDKGNVNASAVPSISATWSGPLGGSGGSNVTLAFAFTQAATASADGTFALTGNVTFTNSSCSLNGTVNSSFIAGPYLVVTGSTNEVDGTTGSFTYTQVLLDNAASPTKMTGTYEVTDTDEPCLGDLITPTFTKQ